MSKFITPLALLTFCAALYLSFTGTWVAADINNWQAKLQGEDKFYPALTASILALPVLLVLAVLKWYSRRKQAKP